MRLHVDKQWRSEGRIAIGNLLNGEPIRKRAGR